MTAHDLVTGEGLATGALFLGGSAADKGVTAIVASKLALRGVVPVVTQPTVLPTRASSNKLP